MSHRQFRRAWMMDPCRPGMAGAVAAMAGALVTMMATPVASQSINLSNISNGIGGFVIDGEAAHDNAG